MSKTEHLNVDGGIIRDLAQDASTKSAILHRRRCNPRHEATLVRSTVQAHPPMTWRPSRLTADRQPSTHRASSTPVTPELLFGLKQASGSYSNIAVSNAAVGIQSYNGAPQIDGFTSTDNTVGVDVYGGMTYQPSTVRLPLGKVNWMAHLR